MRLDVRRLKGGLLLPGHGDRLNRDDIILHVRVMPPRYFQRLRDGSVRLHFIAPRTEPAIIRLRERR